ncbi:Ig-like domain-containing protein [Aliirhizobium terrae]|uniref:Ig-like domain-containing protein n=1 Tax=Terrirhizobium terrae TaxID=2926709 RepID=UPI002575B1B1|nr:Ig-like domain-containing protein [Rhizobium sp. CC-CFT758]WJH41720.1 Ig-like domain-containing protein [Rhizobium sp. CC-CFT758]
MRVTTAAGAVVGTGLVAGDGTFSITLTSPQVTGADLTVVLLDAGDNISPPGLADTPDLVDPLPLTGLVVNASGTELTGLGEAGATVTVTNAAGDPVGTGIVAANGTFSIGLAPAQVDGGLLTAVQVDAAGNDSPPATVLAPGLDFALADASDTAILDVNVTRTNEPTPFTDSESVRALIGLSIGNLATVNLGASTNPVVNFTLAEDTNTVALNLGIGGILNVGLLSNYSVIVERWNGTTWVREDYGTNNVDDGILRLNLLGAPTGTVTLTDLDAGEYRATLVPNPGITLGIGTVRTISVTATDQTEIVNVTVGETAAGNFIDTAASGPGVDDLQVGSVVHEGISYAVGAAGVTIVGDFGSLVMQADGSYVYTPDTGSAAGGTDVFTVTVFDPDTGNALTADLSIDVQADDGSLMMASSDDVVSLAFADDGGGDDGGGAAADDDNRLALADDQSPDADPDATDATADGTGADATGDGTDAVVDRPDAVETASADDGGNPLIDVSIDAGGEEIDLTALDGLSDDPALTVDADVSLDQGVNADVDVPAVTETVTEVVDAPPLDPFEPLNQDDDLANQRLPVV